MEKVLEHAVKFFYLRKDTAYSLNSLGILLLDNIKKEWLNSVATIQPEPVFPVSSVSPSSYREGLKMNQNRLPFGLISVQNKDFGFGDVSELKSEDLTVAFVCSASTEMKWFDYWLRSRRAWWIKYLRHPDLVAQTALSEDSSSFEIKLPSGTLHLETVSRVGNQFFDEELDLKPFMVKSGIGKPSLPSVIKTTTSSHQALLTFLADGYNTRPSRKSSEERTGFLQLHHLLAPWKVGFVLPAEKDQSGQPLYELAMLLASELKTSRINVAALRFGTADTNSKWLDGAGVPFTVFLNETTLSTGICSLRSRDTTISEQVHIGNLRQHLLKYLVPYVNLQKVK